MRLVLAKHVEEISGDPETAADIRFSPMSDAVRKLIRKIAMMMLHREGFDVECEYVDDTEADDEEAETEIENETERDETECDDDFESDTGEMDTEYGFVRKARCYRSSLLGMGVSWSQALFHNRIPVYLSCWMLPSLSMGLNVLL